MHESSRGIAFLQDLAAAVVEESRVRPGARVAGFGPNTSGGTLIRPGGRQCYPAFWIRDFAMSVDSGLITPEEQRHALLYTAANQQEGDRFLKSGSTVPHGSIPDHISFDGIPIFFPGSIRDAEGQGGIYGKRPCADDHYFFNHMAWRYLQVAGDAAILHRPVAGRPLLERLDLAFAAPRSEPDSHLVFCDETDRAVSFGFTDSIVHTGRLFFASVLKYRAARQMADIHRRFGSPRRAQEYARIAATLKTSIPETFGLATGLFRASTGKSAQPDVWGTAFAVHTRLIEGRAAQKAGTALAEAYRRGTLAYRGNIRHVLTCDDFSPSSAWECTLDAARFPKNRYQNGAYWGTPTGWICYAIAMVDAPLAAHLAREYLDELRSGDFRQGSEFGSPWECIHPDGDYHQNPVYMTSVTAPLAAFRDAQSALGLDFPPC